MNSKKTKTTKLQLLLDAYAESHQNAKNKKIHFVCVPIIFWSIVGFFYAIPNQLLISSFGNLFLVNWATIALLFVLIYYISLSIRLSFGMLIFSFFCLISFYLIELYVPVSILKITIITFVIAWIGQFYGHQLEGKNHHF
ncbi:Mpo1 family 2-hydroxy fatty acid dioxygenase [Aureivirga marina]|uniref:Mpo1 family 2-hydroxy fatty acid dioxygenase n=1 Tax=Aureivirga marina TaxID=1182451 RepID=UPI001E43C75C|nr:Mpo1-like protein [Aureivirga marina]